MASSRRTAPLVHLSQYVALRAVSALMHSFPVEENLRTAAAIGRAFFHANPRRRARAEGNVAASYPEWDASRVADVAERSMQHMFQLFMVDAHVMPRLVTPATWSRTVELGGVGPALERLVRGRPLILLTAHCGNWEILGYTLATIGYPVAALARPLDNPYVNRWLLGVREARGMRIITKFGATPVLQEHIERGGHIGFTADQNAGEGGVFVPFFGRLASSYKSIGLLAMRYDLPIVAGHARRLDGRFRYRMEVTDIIEPEDWVDQPDPLFYVTARYNRAMEMMIRAAPEQYLWIHRRWKSRPRHEREGAPMPGRLIGKLEALPWMTQAELDRIVASSSPGAAPPGATATAAGPVAASYTTA